MKLSVLDINNVKRGIKIVRCISEASDSSPTKHQNVETISTQESNFLLAEPPRL